MKEKIQNTMSGIVDDQTKEREKLESAYPIVKTLCQQISNAIKQNLPALPEESSEVPAWWKNLANIAQAVNEEPAKIKSRAAEIEGFLKGVNMTISQIEDEDKKIEQAARVEKKIEDVAKKISSGDIDPDDRRKVGNRPESLKTLRMAQAKLSEDDN